MPTSLFVPSASLLSLLLLVPVPALAEGEDDNGADQPSTEVEAERPLPRRPAKLFTAGMNLDFWFPRDETVISNFGQQAQIGWGLTAGIVPWSKYVHTEVTLGIGHRVKNNPSLAVLGSSSTDDSTGSLNTVALLSWPMQLDVMVGVDLADEQPIVPYGRIGLDMVPWTSRTTDENIKGMRGGWHWAAGIAFLLDVIAPRRAASAQARTGIDDAYLTFEYRQTTLDNFGQLPEDGRIDFGGGFFRSAVQLVF